MTSQFTSFDCRAPSACAKASNWDLTTSRCCNQFLVRISHFSLNAWLDERPSVLDRTGRDRRDECAPRQAGKWSHPTGVSPWGRKSRK
jgi:hypothetical protein